MPSIRVDIPNELAEKIERTTIDSGESRQKIIQSIIKQYYTVDPRELQHKQELLDAALRENEILREHVDLLRGVSVMIMTKQLLPAGEIEEIAKKPSWMARIKQFLTFGRL